MFTELENLLDEDPQALNPDPVLMVIHFEFTGTKEDKINIPLCGETRKDKIITKNFDAWAQMISENPAKHVACRDCLAVLQQLACTRDCCHEKAKTKVAGFKRGPYSNRKSGKKGLVPVPDDKGHFPIENCCDMEDIDLVPLAEQVLGTDKKTFWKNIMLHKGDCESLLHRVKKIPKIILPDV